MVTTLSSEIIDYVTETHNEFAGTTFSLTCTYMSDQAVSVSWKKVRLVICPEMAID